jgi:predicted Fe-Mo cluster-binding NifX family protein
MVAPCFEYSATITIFTIRKARVVDQVDFCLQSSDPLDRVRLMRDQKVNTLICGGLEERLEDMLQTDGVRVISWVSGSVEKLLECHLSGQLVAGTGRIGIPRQDN